MHNNLQLANQVAGQCMKSRTELLYIHYYILYQTCANPKIQRKLISLYVNVLHIKRNSTCAQLLIYTLINPKEKMFWGTLSNLRILCIYKCFLIKNVYKISIIG